MYGSHTVVITPKTSPSPVASPYSVTFSNNGTSAISIFYNQAADSPAGKITGGIGTSSIAFAHARSASASTPRRFAMSWANKPAFTSQTIEVQYDVAGFSGARTFGSVESAHGIARAQNFVQTASSVTRVLTVGQGQNVDAVVAGLRSEPGVTYVNRVGLRYPASPPNPTVYPNDPYFNATNDGATADQWYLWRIDSMDAWSYGQGTAPIAVVDSGYDPNQTDLASQVKYSETVLNLLVYANTAIDTDGHGTWLSGIAGAQTNNAAGFAGASYNAPLQEYKIFANGSTSAQTTDEAAAIRDAVAKGAKVILLALQSNPAFGPDPVERDAVAFAIQSGVTVVASSGDDAGTALDYPAGYPGVISVGASAVQDPTPGVISGEQVASYSNYGTGLGLVAPGGQPTGASDTDILHWIENLYTTQPYSGLPACASGVAPPDCKVLNYGTSPAAAMVAGTASLMITANSSLTPSSVASLLFASTDDIKDPKEGHGRLNAQRAVALAAGDPSPLPAYPLPRAVQFVAIAYPVNGVGGSGSTLPVKPTIINMAYPNGVPVNVDGTFRIADIPTSLPTGGTQYKVAVWLSLHGDGMVHPGDYFTFVNGKPGAITCSNTTPCGGIANMTVGAIPIPSPGAANPTLP